MKIHFFILFILLYTLSFGQSKQDKRIVEKVDGLISDNFKNHTPGCVVLIAKNGKILFENAYGLANLELNVSMKPEMVFRIGSITKEFTAVSILQLVEKGQIALEDSIQKFIKNFRFKGKTITVENLLTHTSGIKGYEQLDSKIPNAIRVDFQTKIIIDSLDRLTLDFEPGTKYNYSNSNYFLLGYIIEQVTGKSYQQYLKENIFEPVGLKSTFYESQTLIIPNRTNGYSYSNGKYLNSDFISMSLVYSAGALRSNVDDLFKWHNALYGGKILKKETFLKAITPYKLVNGTQSEYGYGFFIKNENGIISIGHGGAIDGFRAIELYYPNQDIYMLMLCNSDQNNFEQLFQGVANIVLGINEQVREIKLSDEILNRYVGTFKNDKYNVSIKIYLVNGRIYGDLSNGTGTNMTFLAITESKFFLPDIKKVKTMAEFIQENGKVRKLIFTQEQPIEFLKIE